MQLNPFVKATLHSNYIFEQQFTYTLRISLFSTWVKTDNKRLKLIIFRLEYSS